MAISISNQIENHRGVYVQVVGDGATTAIPITHHMTARPNHTVSVALAVTAPTNHGAHSGKGGFVAPGGGTAITISSVTISGSVITVNTSAAIGNGTTGYIVVLFDQHTT
jgi:hypothetical protein